MMQRCYNPNDRKFKNYGARGITVCERWHDAANFISDMGKKPSPACSIGRINNDGSYSPENCRWETAMQQARNRRSNRLTLAKAREIRMLSERGYSQGELAREFKVSVQIISDILIGRIWSEDPTNPIRKVQEIMKNSRPNSTQEGA